MILRIALISAGSLALLMLTIRVLIWQWCPSTRPCKWFGHDKKYVGLALKGCVPHNDPTSSGRSFPCDHKHQVGDKDIYMARWACRRCPVLGEECLGKDQDWTIRHEQLVPDVKKWANWGQPPQDENELARQKLAEIRARIDAEKKDPYCENCGWEHTGPCLPGGLS